MFGIVAFATCVMFASCGAKKQVAQNEVRPTRTERELDKCVLKAQEKSSNLRAWATAVSYVEQQAVSQATQIARNELASAIRTSVEGAVQNFANSANADQRVTSKMLNGSLYHQYVAEELANGPPILTSMYDLSDGTIQVYVCIEMRPEINEVVNKIYKSMKQEVSDDEILRMQLEQQQFEQQMKARLEEYKAKRRQEAEGL